MKGRVLATLLGILILAGLLAISGTAQEPITAVDRDRPSFDGPTFVSVNDPRSAESPSAPADIGNSTVNSVSPSEIMIGFDYDLCFNVTFESADEEYVDRFDVNLPDNWTIKGINPVPQNTNCGWTTIAGQDPGNVAYWQVDTTLPSGCGAWISGTYDFCVRISVPDCSGEPWGVDWTIVGDGFAAPPHEVSGVVGPLSCRAPGLYLTPDSIFSSGCAGDPKEFTLNLFNYTLADATFSLTYEVTTYNATLTGPDAIYLGHGADQDFIAVLTPEACLREGDVALGWISAEGNSYAESTWVYRDIYSSPLCPDSGCRYIYLPLTLRNH